MKTTSPALCCRGLTVRYRGTSALDDVDLEVAPGELVALLGASGSGKSTLLNAVAGLVRPAAGEILINGRPVADAAHSVPPERRDVGMVFQNFALWPHMSALETVAYPLRRAGRSPAAARDAARELLERLGIAHLADRRPAELSGGEQQRVGLGRALARRARLYLLDEPTAHLDTHLRAAFHEPLIAMQRATGAAAVYATHDGAEALALADRIALLDAGRILQTGTPQEIYCEPVSLTAAVLTGPCSVLTARRVDPVADGAVELDLGEGAVEVTVNRSVAGAHLVLVRPDWVSEHGPFTACVEDVAFRGQHTEYRLRTAAGAVLASRPGPPQAGVGDRVTWGLSRVCLLAAGTEDPSTLIPAR